MASELGLKPQVYTLQDFVRISENVEFDIHEDVIKMINVLADKVGAPSYQRTPNFKNREHRNGGRGGGDRRRRKKQNMEISDADWEAIRSFQATELEQKEGIDNLIDKIKGEINKLTDMTYDTQLEKICDILNNMASNESFGHDDRNKVGEVIFDIASSNKFYSKIYAKLFAHINEKFDFMNGVFNLTKNNYMSKLTNIETVDAKKDYEKFCQINKENENRKALSSFFVNLMKEGVVDTSVVFEIANSLMDKLHENLNNDSTEIIDQLSENINIIVCESWEHFTENDDFDDDCDELKDRVEHVSLLKSRDYTGLSNKTIFQFMDITENIN